MTQIFDYGSASTLSYRHRGPDNLPKLFQEGTFMMSSPRRADPRLEPLAKAVWAFRNERHHHQAREQLRRARRLLKLGFGGAHEYRRAEDRIRLERHDSRAVTIKAGHRVRRADI